MWNSITSIGGAVSKRIWGEKSPQQGRLDQLNNLAQLAAKDVTLNVNVQANGSITVSGNVGSGYTLSKDFYNFLNSNQIKGITLTTTSGGKIIGFTAKDEKAFNNLLNVYADNKKVDKGAFPRILSVSTSPAESPKASPKTSPKVSPKASPVGTPVERRSVEMKREEKEVVARSPQERLDQVNAKTQLAALGITLSANVQPDGSIEVKGNDKKSAFILVPAFQEFLKDNTMGGITLITYSGKEGAFGEGNVIGFNASNETAFNALLDAYVASKGKETATKETDKGKEKEKVKAEKKEVAEVRVSNKSEGFDRGIWDKNQELCAKDRNGSFVVSYDLDEKDVTIREMGGVWKESAFSDKFTEFLKQEEQRGNVTITKNQGGINGFKVSNFKALNRLIEDFKKL